MIADTGLREELIDDIRFLAKKYGIKRVVLFGSRARGEYKKKSDIDLAFSGGEVSRFALSVEEDTPTLLKFDLVDLDGPVSPALRESIDRDGMIIYEQQA